MQLELFDVPSPCIDVCQTDVKGYCLGCLRTRAERQNWVNLTVSDKRKVIKRCKQREKKRNGPAKSKQVIAKQPLNQPLTEQGSLLDNLEPQPDNEKNAANPVGDQDLDFSDFEL
jgi:predicted Fe-S protein YdhL (DUF1289 family)